MTRVSRNSCYAGYCSETLKPNSRPNPFADRGRARGDARRAFGFARAPGFAAGRDPFEIRAAMAGRWGVWVRRHFRRPEEAAVAFGVTHQCARNWFEDLHKPSGDTLLIAADLWGAEFLAHMMGEP